MFLYAQLGQDCPPSRYHCQDHQSPAFVLLLMPKVRLGPPFPGHRESARPCRESADVVGNTIGNRCWQATWSKVVPCHLWVTTVAATAFAPLIVGQRRRWSEIALASVRNLSSGHDYRSDAGRRHGLSVAHAGICVTTHAPVDRQYVLNGHWGYWQNGVWCCTFAMVPSAHTNTDAGDWAVLLAQPSCKWIHAPQQAADARGRSGRRTSLYGVRLRDTPSGHSSTKRYLPSATAVRGLIRSIDIDRCRARRTCKLHCTISKR
jgi:hypothetical protein